MQAVKQSLPLPRETIAPHISDEALVAMIADEDKQALKIFYQRHQVRVLRFVQRLLGNESTAEEVTNEVFLEVWRKAHQFEARSKAATWLLAIAHHRAISALRRHAEAHLDEEVAASIEDPADDPETAAGKLGRSAVLDKCLTRLAPQHREVINLIYYQEKKIGEVARELKVPVNTVKTRMFYARNAMANLLTEVGVDRAWVAI